MPKYDYHCDANGRTVEVNHRMSEEITTWGDLCARAGTALDDTPADTPVHKFITPSLVAQRDNLGCDAGPPIENAGLSRGGMWRE